MTNIIFCLSGNTFSYRFLADWTRLLQECTDCNIKWQAFFNISADLNTIFKQHSKTKYNYLMLIASDSIFEPKHFWQLFNKMERDPEIDSLAAKSSKKDSAGLDFALIRRGIWENLPKGSHFCPPVDQETIIGYEKTIIWR